MSTGPKKVETRGGYRPGAGRPKTFEFSERERKKLIKSAKAREKETGKSIAEALLDLIYMADDKIKLAAIKTYYDSVLVHETHSETDLTMNQAPVVLPERRADPANLTIVKQAKAANE